MRALQLGIGASNHRSGFAEPKSQLPKESLTLPSTEFGLDRIASTFWLGAML
jgi:hypothetical protein